MAYSKGNGPDRKRYIRIGEPLPRHGGNNKINPHRPTWSLNADGWFILVQTIATMQESDCDIPDIRLLLDSHGTLVKRAPEHADVVELHHWKDSDWAEEYRRLRILKKDLADKANRSRLAKASL